MCCESSNDISVSSPLPVIYSPQNGGRTGDNQTNYFRLHSVCRFSPSGWNRSATYRILPPHLPLQLAALLALIRLLGFPFSPQPNPLSPFSKKLDFSFTESYYPALSGDTSAILGFQPNKYILKSSRNNVGFFKWTAILVEPSSPMQ